MPRCSAIISWKPYKNLPKAVTLRGMTLQELCEAGQTHLMRTDYLAAERLLAQAEQIAWESHDWDTLSRLYMPLQETRRQRRLVCGDGIVQLDLLAMSPTEQPNPNQLTDATGQFLIAGWKSLSPAIALRKLQQERNLYLETFLAAVYPTDGAKLILIAPTADAQLPKDLPATLDEARAAIPAGCLLIDPIDLPAGRQNGTADTFAFISALWERLHLPWLRDADTEPELETRIAKYRKVIEIDYACELAHQKLSAAARQLAQQSRR